MTTGGIGGKEIGEGAELGSVYFEGKRQSRAGAALGEPQAPSRLNLFGAKSLFWSQTGASADLGLQDAVLTDRCCSSRGVH